MEFDIVNFTALRNLGYAKETRNATGTASSSSGSWVTLVSISGKGALIEFSAQYGSSGTSTADSFRITIDGGTPVVISTTGVLYIGGTTEYRFALPLCWIPFASSVLVEYSQSNATASSATANVVWGVA